MKGKWSTGSTFFILRATNSRKANWRYCKKRYVVCLYQSNININLTVYVNAIRIHTDIHIIKCIWVNGRGGEVTDIWHVFNTSMVFADSFYTRMRNSSASLFNFMDSTENYEKKMINHCKIIITTSSKIKNMKSCLKYYNLMISLF